MKQSAVVLIVDDQASNRETLRELLAPQNYQIVEAADGPTALRLAAETQPDLILLDVMMPGTDGYEVCRRLRADSRLSAVPVIMLTALDDQASRLAGLEAGADDFITKPFNRAELRARVHTITRLNRYRRLLETQEQLRESETRFRQLAEHSAEVFWFATLSPWQIAYVSPAVEKIWGLPVARFYEDAHLWEKTIHPEDQPTVRAAFDAVLTGAVPRFEAEYRVVQPDGAIRWVLDTGTPIRNGDDVIVRVGGVARDITERKEADELMLRAQRLENIGMLAAGIAHDFNNALAPILMAGPLLRQHIQDPGGQQILNTVDKCAERGAGLVRQLLTFARGAGGNSQLMQAGHVLREVVDLARATFPKSIRVRLHIPGDLWPVQANPTQFHQIVLNLCVNARDAMPQGGELRLTAENRVLDDAAAGGLGAQPGQYLIIEVRDTGTGIPPEVLARIWEPFFTTKGEGKGTGLGLSTVQGIIQNHRGLVTVQTRVGHGTTFTVYLPAAEGSIGGSEPGTRVVEAIRGHGELILVVDDEEAVRELTARILGDHGYRVITASDGAEAIAVFAARAADVRLLLTDSDMPRLGGAALTVALRRLKPALPVISMSGAASLGSGTRENSSTPLLPKPFQTETLLSIVRRTLDDASLPVSSPRAT